MIDSDGKKVHCYGCDGSTVTNMYQVLECKKVEHCTRETRIDTMSPFFQNSLYKQGKWNFDIRPKQDERVIFLLISHKNWKLIFLT